MKTTMFVMMGLPGSGKSYFASRLASKIGAVWLNSDGMRLAIFQNNQGTLKPGEHQQLFGAMQYAARQALCVGINTIYDTNSNKRVYRDDSHELAGECGADMIVVYIKTDDELSRKRTIKRETTDHQVKLPPGIFERFKSNFELPQEYEKTITINGDEEFEKQYESFQSQMNSLRLK